MPSGDLRIPTWDDCYVSIPTWDDSYVENAEKRATVRLGQKFC